MWRTSANSCRGFSSPPLVSLPLPAGARSCPLDGEPLSSSVDMKEGSSEYGIAGSKEA